MSAGGGNLHRGLTVGGDDLDLPGAGSSRLRDSPPVRLTLSAVAVGALAVLAACDDDGGGDAERFCNDVAANVDELRAEPTTDAEVESLIGLWARLGRAAPLAIEQEWDARTENLELAWTSDDEQEILAATFAFERSGVAIATWLDETCGIDFGPVTTIVPPGPSTSATPAPSATTTAPP